jgi:hypothetical protein
MKRSMIVLASAGTAPARSAMPLGKLFSLWLLLSLNKAPTPPYGAKFSSDKAGYFGILNSACSALRKLSVVSAAFLTNGLP